jgi:hypothetical protein
MVLVEFTQERERAGGTCSFHRPMAVSYRRELRASAARVAEVVGRFFGDQFGFRTVRC